MLLSSEFPLLVALVDVVLCIIWSFLSLFEIGALVALLVVGTASQSLDLTLETRISKSCCWGFISDDEDTGNDYKKEKLEEHSVEMSHNGIKWKIYSHLKNISSDQLFCNFFRKMFLSRDFCQKCVRVNFHNYDTVCV